MRTYRQYRDDGHTVWASFVLSVPLSWLLIGAALFGAFIGLFVPLP